MKETYIAPFEIKTLEESGIISGYASTFDKEKDSYGDVVVAGAFSKSIARGGRNGTGIPMLWQHNAEDPIGKWNTLVEDSKGLATDGKLTRGVQKADEAYLLAKDKVIQALSIGYNTIEYDYDSKTDTRYLIELDLWETSLVTFPAKTSALITNVKDAITQAESVRDIEALLRQNGMSLKEAKMIISKVKGFVDEKKTKNYLSDALLELRKINTTLEHKRVIPFRSFSLSNDSWDGPGEIAKADVSDLKIMCTWYDSENSDAKSSYKLPHHKADGYATVWRGVAAAMAALLGARGGVQIPDADRRGVYNHLAKHYQEFEKEPPAFKSYYDFELQKIEMEELQCN